MAARSLMTSGTYHMLWLTIGITQRPDITSRFTSGASFLPVGPLLLKRPPGICLGIPAPAVLSPVPDRYDFARGESAIINAGCFYPGASTKRYISRSYCDRNSIHFFDTNQLQRKCANSQLCRSSGKTWKPDCFELLAHNTEPQMVSGETILPAPSDVVIISGKTDSAAPLASRITRSTVASDSSTHENALPFSSVNCKGRSNYRSYR